jgi:histo-blood group ABO system transferase
MQNKVTIGVLLIATDKYNRLVSQCVKSIRRYFCRDSCVKIFLHSDSALNFSVDKQIAIAHEPWPMITLKRFHIFNAHMPEYAADYLFYLDVDNVVVDHIATEDILGDLVVARHSGFIHNNGTPETRPVSTAYIPESEPITYVTGSFFGGKKEYFDVLSQQLAEDIDLDLSNGVIAAWHDESHLNKYVYEYGATKILDSRYNCRHNLPAEEKAKILHPKIFVCFNTPGPNKFQKG